MPYRYSIKSDDALISKESEVDFKSKEEAQVAAFEELQQYFTKANFTAELHTSLVKEKGKKDTEKNTEIINDEEFFVITKKTGKSE